MGNFLVFTDEEVVESNNTTLKLKVVSGGPNGRMMEIEIIDAIGRVNKISFSHMTTIALINLMVKETMNFHG